MAGLKPKIIGDAAEYKFGINTAPAFLNADTAGSEANNVETPLMDSDSNTIALAITSNREKTIKYDGVAKVSQQLEPGQIITVADPQTGENVTGIVGADSSYTESRTDWAKVSFSLHIYPCMKVTDADVHGYKGPWNADTNVPVLSDSDVGLLVNDMYFVTVAGTQDTGGGSQIFAYGDFVVWNGTLWTLQDNS